MRATMIVLPLLLISFSIPSLSIQPPPKLGAAMGKMMKVVEKLAPVADNLLTLHAMTQQAMGDAEAQASAAEQDTAVGRVVSTLIEARLNTFVYTGMCRRNYTNPCPNGWTQTGGETSDSSDNPATDEIKCAVEAVDPDNPNPACETYTIGPDTDFGPSAKEAFALECKVQWPCAACKRDFSGCPENFKAVKGICYPRSSYVGPCGDAVDFRKTQDTVIKARWAARCRTSWPCIRE
jgi:CPW-WPC domain-containing protein